MYISLPAGPFLTVGLLTTNSAVIGPAQKGFNKDDQVQLFMIYLMYPSSTNTSSVKVS